MANEVCCSLSTDVEMTAIPSTPVKENKDINCISDPAPRQVSDNELQVLQECLHRWRTEVEQDVKGKPFYQGLNYMHFYNVHKLFLLLLSCFLLTLLIEC